MPSSSQFPSSPLSSACYLIKEATVVETQDETPACSPTQYPFKSECKHLLTLSRARAKRVGCRAIALATEVADRCLELKRLQLAKQIILNTPSPTPQRRPTILTDIVFPLSCKIVKCTGMHCYCVVFCNI